MLVIWTVVTRGRGFNGGLATPGVQLPAMAAIVICVCILAMSGPRLVHLMPLLLPPYGTLLNRVLAWFAQGGSR